VILTSFTSASQLAFEAVQQEKSGNCAVINQAVKIPDTES
jgi:hypothetical protein